MTILGAWIGVGAVVSTIWSKYVNDRWWSGTPLGFVVQIVIGRSSQRSCSLTPQGVAHDS